MLVEIQENNIIRPQLCSGGRMLKISVVDYKNTTQPDFAPDSNWNNLFLVLEPDYILV